ncbi:MAG TPA: glutathione S-transferase family protein [Kofleriaceae bacterium]|jgi:glutathione S-transferase
MLKLFGFSRVNKMARGNTRDLRVLWALEEMQVPYEIAGMDHPNHDLDASTFRVLNPFGQLPVIDDDGVVLSESAAIVIYLARKCGKLIPSDLAGEAQVLRWSFAAMNTVEMPLLSYWFVGMVAGKEGKAREGLAQFANRHLSALDTWLGARTFIATDEFTVADILMSHVLISGADEELLAPYAHVRSYRDRCKARPAWQRTIERYCERVEAA